MRGKCHIFDKKEEKIAYHTFGFMAYSAVTTINRTLKSLSLY